MIFMCSEKSLLHLKDAVKFVLCIGSARNKGEGGGGGEEIQTLPKFRIFLIFCELKFSFKSIYQYRKH